ncbi:UNVERIFIED_CONTAM: hypothetical protein GTU68_060444 [Idotea baltica]|nr:hypothetical protein [Idotea baltica]
MRPHKRSSILPNAQVHRYADLFRFLIKSKSSRFSVDRTSIRNPVINSKSARTSVCWISCRPNPSTVTRCISSTYAAGD